MILPNEVAKKIEECCVKIDNLEKALDYAIEIIKLYQKNTKCKMDVLSHLYKLKEGKEV